MRKTRGFTLIEMAIVVMVTGILMAGALQYYTAQIQKQRVEVTKKRLEEIRTALTIYTATKGKLPCPDGPVGRDAKFNTQGKRGALTRDSVGGDPKGKNADSCAPGAPLPPGVVATSTPGDVEAELSDRQVWIGVVPTRELRLNREQTLDGWGNQFTYAVSRKLSFPDGMRGNPTPGGTIAITDEKGVSLVLPPGSGRYVVLSHGATGNGAWTPDGGKKNCAHGTLDEANCDGDAKFVISPYSRGAGMHFFDDFIIHDDPNVGGTLLDRLIVCNAKKAFYAPAEPGADKDGCLGLTNVWEGACRQTERLQDDGTWVAMPAIVMMKPSVIAGTGCGCDPGYRVVQAGNWDDSAMGSIYAQNSGSHSTVPNPNPIAAASPPQNFTRTGLYVCMK